jgi:Icc-related predicted phosphoesterase
LKNCTSRDQHRYSVAVIIKSICAWCWRVLRDGVEPVTHGICDACICRLCDITLEDLAARRAEWAAELASGEVETKPSIEHQGVSQVKSDADLEHKASNPETKILLTADLHNNRSWFEWLLTEAPKYDLVSIAGDFLDMFAADEGGQIDYLRKEWLPAVTRTGVPLALCTGNHDHVALTWLSYVNRPPLIVGDGETQLLTFRSGQKLVVTTCPYYRTFQRRDSVMAGLWQYGARLRDSENAPWLVVHHEPPAPLCPKGTIATHWLGLRMQEYHPDFVACGHFHETDRSPFGVKIDGTWCFNAGQRLDAPRPNYIVLDLSARTATRRRMVPVRETLSWVPKSDTITL